MGADVEYEAHEHSLPGGARRTRPERVVVRCVLLAVLVLFPFQAAFALLIAEPYPALTQPGFGSVPEADGLVTVEGLEISATFADGGTVEVDEHELFREVTGISVRFASRLVFGPEQGEPDAWSDRARAAVGLLTPPWYDPPADRADHPATRSWLRRRLTEIAPRRDAVRVTFRWLDLTHPARDPGRVLGRETTHVRVIDL